MFRSPVIPPSLWLPLCVWGLRVHNSQIDREQLEVSQCDVSQETGCWETGRAGPVWLWLTAHSAAVDKNTSVHRPHHSPLTSSQADISHPKCAGWGWACTTAVMSTMLCFNQSEGPDVTRHTSHWSDWLTLPSTQCSHSPWPWSSVIADWLLDR